MKEKNINNKKILMYGSFKWNRLAASYKRAFEALGHDVYTIDRRERNETIPSWILRGGSYVSPSLSKPKDSFLSRCWLSLRRWIGRVWNNEVVRIVNKANPDLILIINGDLIMPDTVRGIRREGFPVYILHADNPFFPYPNARPEHLPCAKACTGYFIWSRKLRRRLGNLDVNAHYLPFAWDPTVFPVKKDETSLEFEVVFIGGWSKKREKWLTPVAKRFDLKIWGPNYWGTRTSWGSPLRECWQNEAVHGKHASRVVSKSKIALNILRDQNLPDGTIMRTFEIPGSGNFLLSSRTAGATEIFPEGIAGGYFESREELLEKIDHYLTHGNKRRSIAENAHERVRNSHRYRHRAEKILQVHEKEG